MSPIETLVKPGNEHMGSHSIRTHMKSIRSGVLCPYS